MPPATPPTTTTRIGASVAPVSEVLLGVVSGFVLIALLHGGPSVLPRYPLGYPLRRFVSGPPDRYRRTP